jgi:hypothetical protein
MNSYEYIWHCKPCNTLRFDITDSKCKFCNTKSEDVTSKLQTIEDAIWWGSKHPDICLSPSIYWEMRDFDRVKGNW